MKDSLGNSTLGLIRAHLVLYLWTVVVGTLGQVAGIPLALLTRRMIHLVANEVATHDLGVVERQLWLMTAALAALAVFRGVARWGRGVLGEVFAQRCVARLRKRMLDKLQLVGLGYFERRAAGKIVVRFVGDAQGLRSWFATKVVGVPSDVLTIVAVLWAIGMIHVQLLYAVLIPLVVLVPLALALNPRTRSLTREARREQARLTGELTQLAEFVGALRVSGGGHELNAIMHDRVDRIAGAFVRRSLIESLSSGLSVAMGSLSLCAIGAWGAMLILHQQANTGDIVGAVWLCVLLRSPVNRLASASISWQRVKVGFDRIEALLERREARQGGEGITIPDGAMRVRAKNLGYRARDGAWLFRGVHALVKGPGLVLVRGSPSATRSFFELMMALRRATEGRVGVGGVNVRKADRSTLYRRVGWVDAQRGVVCARVLRDGIERVREHLLASDLELEAGEVDRVLNRVGLGEPMPELSGLVGLRVAIGCALIDDAMIVVIDQPERGLDQGEVRWLASYLRRISMNRLVILGSKRGLGLGEGSTQIRLSRVSD